MHTGTLIHDVWVSVAMLYLVYPAAARRELG
jgi:hypothetical protein